MGNSCQQLAGNRTCCGRTHRRENMGYTFEGGEQLGWENTAEEYENGKAYFEREPDADFPEDPSVCGGKGEDFCPAAAVPALMGKDRGSTKLFEQIEVHDILQGGMGDCWLIAAIAGLAEYPELIEAIFPDQGPDLSEDGQYVCRLFKPEDGMSEHMVEINDIVAMVAMMDWGGEMRWWTPCFARPTGNEIWVMLLEKACAKLMGSYQAMNGGSSLYAWAMLTGSTDAFIFQKSEEEWAPMKITEFTSTCGYSGFFEDKLDKDEMFDKLDELDGSGYMACCGCGTYDGGIGGEPQLTNGLVSGHAFTVVSLHRISDDVKLVQIRNPWGNEVEWSGAWSDGSAEWDTPEGQEAQAQIRSEGFEIGRAGDGKFWMDWEDVHENFDSFGAIKVKCIRDKGGGR